MRNNMQNNDIYCDVCRKKIFIFLDRTWNPFNKIVKCVVRLKEHVWVEYYHMNCLIKSGRARRIKKQKAGRWDKDDDKGPTTNLVH